MKRNYVLLAVLAMLLAAGPILISCQNAAGDDGGPSITGYVSLDDGTTAPAVPHHTVNGGEPVNPPGMKVETAKQPNGDTHFEVSGDVGDDFPNSVVEDDFTGGGTPFGSEVVSTMVIAGIVDPAKPGTIRQYNQALNAYTSLPNYVFNFKTPNVYKERYYDAGEYYPAELGGFDVLLWEAAPSKIITLIVTQEGVTKTYIIDYSDTVFNP
jgi:hypothetical protein